MASSIPPPSIEPYDSSLSVSGIAIKYFDYHLKVYDARQDQLRALKEDRSSAFGARVPQLKEVAAAEIARSLRRDPAEGLVGMVIDSVPAHLLSSVMKDPRIHYRTFRRMNAKRVEEKAAGEGDEIDEWIQCNEKWLRVDGTNWGLVTLEDAKEIFPTATHTPTEIKIPRRQPPSTSFCFLDQKRPSSISILPSTERFIETFNRVTDNCLKGLDWTNVFLAGGMPLNVLLCTDPRLDSTFVSSDIDLYFYGLDPAQANAKMAHVYSVWSANIGKASVAAGVCVRNSRTVNFLGRFPQRRIQIVLKIVATPAEVLLNFDLDPCAIGFDGTQVMMLPRAARALETGYTTFTTHLVYGHHLGDRRETQETRVFKYASRGFGLRILPCSIASLTLDMAARIPHEAAGPRLSRNFNNPPGPKILTGLKAVKRVAFTAEDMVRRFVLNEVGGVVNSVPEDFDNFDNRNWVNTATGDVPICSFRNLDALKQHIGQPGRSAIKSFELFFRHCTAWKLECEGRLKIDYDDFADTYMTGGVYDDLPEFSWGAGFSVDKFKQDIDMYNEGLDSGVLEHFERLYDRNWHEREFSDMKIKPARIVHAASLAEVMKQQVAIPVFIGADLADHFDRVYSAVGVTDPLFYRHVHKDGNILVRLWLIGTETMWARIDRTIDEIFETLWTFFHIEQLTPKYIGALELGRIEDRDGGIDGGSNAGELQYLVQESFERRIVRPIKAPSRDTTAGFFAWPDDDEVRRFDLWMREHPCWVFRGPEAPFSATSLFDEDRYMEEPDEDLYWGSADEREDGGEKKGKRKRVYSTLVDGEKLARAWEGEGSVI